MDGVGDVGVGQDKQGVWDFVPYFSGFGNHVEVAEGEEPEAFLYAYVSPVVVVGGA